MALDAYVKTCAKNVAGNHYKVYLGNPGDITAITVSAGGEITAITAASPKLQMVQAEVDSVKFESKGTGGQNYFTEQTLTMKFGKKSVATMTLLNSLASAIACGIIAVRVDGNGIAWLSGYDAAAVDKTARPYNKMEHTFDSGTKPSDVEGNALTIMLKRESENEEIPFDATLSAALVGGTATAWVEYT